MSHYPNGFAPVAGRQELRSAMRNRFYNDVSRPGHYGFPHDSVTADMVPLGARRSRGIRGLGDICDDEGAALGVGIASSVMGLIGAGVSASGASTVGEGGAKTGGDTGRARAGEVFSGAGNALVDAWSAACLSSTRGTSTGATPSESMDSVLARARAEWTAAASADRTESMELELAREREAREAQSTMMRNVAIGVGAVAVLGFGGYLLFGRR